MDMKKNILYILMMAFFIMSCEDKIEEEILNETIKPQLQVTLSQDDEDLSLVKIKVELYKFTDNNSSSCYIDSITIKYGTSPSNLTSTLTNGDNIYSSSYNEYECYIDENGTYYFKVVAFCHYSHSGYYGHYGCSFMSNFTLESEVKSITVANVPANEGAVDLGLSVKWAACNLGSTKPYEQGILSVWGNPSIYFNADFDGDTTIAIEDCGGVNPPLCISGTELDIATTQLGGDWRLPTKAEAQELLDSCEWIYTRHHGTEGYIVIGPNGNSIFLPNKDGFIRNMTGCIYHSSYNDYNNFNCYIIRLHSKVLINWNRNDFFNIRPVQGELKKYSYKKVSSITPGKSYLMVADSKAATEMYTNLSSNDHLRTTYAPETNGIITLTDKSCEFTFSKVRGGYNIMDTNCRYYGSDNYRFITTNTPTYNECTWSIEPQADGSMKIQPINTDTDRCIHYRENSFWIHVYDGYELILPTLYERID